MRQFNVLITYASKYGSTHEIAQVVAEEFFLKGFNVEIKNISNVKQISRFNAVIIGAAIHYGQWMKEAKIFIQRFAKDLSKKQTAYFFTCLTLAKNRQKDITQAMKYSNRIICTSELVKPLSVGAFAGELDYSPMGFTEKIAAKAIFSILRIQSGDYRKWNNIYQWIGQTISEMKSNLLQFE